MMATETSAPTAIDPALQGFDDVVRETMREWQVPGLAVAVIKDGAVILARGYGLRDVERGLPATPDTLFAIGSCSKAFTTAAMAMLVEQGVLDWDTPVRRYLPDFALHDPVAAERMTPRDLVTHRSGLPRHDFMWHQSPYTRQELYARLRYLEPNRDFRAVWQYQNLMYMTAGYLSGAVAGMEWEELIRRRIFAPLGMRRSNLSVHDSQADPDFAQPYSEREGAITRVPFADISAVGPAGSINSSVDEMCAWLLLHLHKGIHGKQRLISEGQVEQMHTPQMVIATSGKHPEMPYQSYSLGWVVQPYRGEPMLWHTGGIDGFLSQVTLLPRQRSGAVVLTNLDRGPLMTILSLHLCDRLLGLDHVPWRERLKQDYDEAKAAQEAGKERAAATRAPGTRPSHPLESYAGEYEHPGYGVIAIELDLTSKGHGKGTAPEGADDAPDPTAATLPDPTITGEVDLTLKGHGSDTAPEGAGEGEHVQDVLVATHNQKRSRLEHYHYDIFELHNERFPVRYTASFATGVTGEIESVAIPFEPTAAPIVFKRLPARELRDRAFLEPFTGDYELLGQTVRVTLKGEDSLLLSVPGQPDYELEPHRGTLFLVKGLSGFSVEFQHDATGAVTGAVITQPGGAFTTRKM